MCQTDHGHSNKDLLIWTVLSSTSNSATWVLQTNHVVYETRLQTTYILISDSKSSFKNPKNSQQNDKEEGGEDESAVDEEEGA